MKNDIQRTAIIIKRAQTIGLMTHANGDGDAFGALIGLRNILQDMGKRVIIFSNEKLPNYLEYLHKEIGYKPQRIYKKADLIIILDLNTAKRLTLPSVIKKAQAKNVPVLAVDHHTTGDISDKANYIWQQTDTSSVSEMIYWLATEKKLTINPIAAELLLWGIETDSNFMNNPNTNKKTTHIAERELIRLGARLEKINENLLLTSPLADKKLSDLVFGRAVSNKEYGLTSVYVTANELKKFKLKPGISSVLSNYLDQNIHSKISLAAEQRPGGVIKVSMRANNSRANVARLANFFGGGGHIKAAGFEVKGNLEKIIK